MRDIKLPVNTPPDNPIEKRVASRDRFFALLLLVMTNEPELDFAVYQSAGAIPDPSDF